MRLNGKSALITGGARGIGRAFAERYVAEGARVAIADIDLPRAQETASQIGDQAVAVHMDVTDQASIDGAVAQTVEELGQIDILINNAAIFTAAPITEITRAEYARTFEINVAGTLFTLQAVARHMIDQRIKGRIINMASQAGRRGEPLVAVYCATKAAIISLTQSAGLNLIEHGINVNAISPGVVDGELRSNVPGVHIPDSVIKRLSGAADQKAEGVNICIELIQQIKEIEGVHGVHIMAYRQEHNVPDIVERSNALNGRTTWHPKLYNNVNHQ